MYQGYSWVSKTLIITFRPRRKQDHIQSHKCYRTLVSPHNGRGQLPGHNVDRWSWCNSDTWTELETNTWTQMSGSRWYICICAQTRLQRWRPADSLDTPVISLPDLVLCYSDGDSHQLQMRTSLKTNNHVQHLCWIKNNSGTCRLVSKIKWLISLYMVNKKLCYMVMSRKCISKLLSSLVRSY